MKALLTFILLATFHIGFTQSDTTKLEKSNQVDIFPLKDNIIFYEVIDSTLQGMSKEQLYTRAKTWGDKNI